MKVSPTESRERVKGGLRPVSFAPWVPQSTRGHSMKVSPTESRKRESRGSKTLWRGQGAAPLGFPQSTRGSSMQSSPTQSRERVKGGTPLRGQGAAPLGSLTPSAAPQSARKHLSGFPSRSAARCACRSSCRCRKSAGRSGNRTCPRRIRLSAAACRRGSRRRRA